MNQLLKLREGFASLMERFRKPHDLIAFKTHVKVELFDKFGNLKYEEETHNQITDEGYNTLLDVMFHAATQITTWYFGLINSSGYSGINVADVMNSHAGWTEFTAYDESTRVEWQENSPASKSITNTTVATFTFNATGTVKGAFLTSGSAKSGTTGKLWSSVLLSSDLSVVDDDLLKITYTISA